MKWDLIVNLDKTKVIVFNNYRKHSMFDKFYYNKKRIDIVSQYKYLGITFSATMSLNDHFREKSQIIKNIVLGSLSKLKKHKGIQHSIKFKIFQITCQSILCYSAQVWDSEYNDEIEKVL